MSAIQLHRAAVAGNVGELQRLLDSGVPVDSRDENGATPLFAAAYQGLVVPVRLLLEYGADVNAGNNVNYTPLMTACREKHIAVVEALLQAKADPGISSQSGHKAAQWCLFDTVPNDRKWSTEKRAIEVLQLLKQYGTDLNARGNEGNTVLMDAAGWSLVEVVQFLLKAGVDSVAKDNSGKAAVDYAQSKLEQNLNEATNERCRQIMKLLTRGGKAWWKFW
jgi:ankyrin repeat protein